MSDPEIVRANARRKEIASGFGRLATTLIVAIVAKTYLDGFDVAVLLWCVSAGALIWLSWLVLSLLEPER